MVRLSLDKKNRKLLFEELKKYYKVKNLRELAERTEVKYKTIKKWSEGVRLTPKKIIPNEILEKVKIKEIKDDNWGVRKGGKIGIKKLRQKYSKEIKKEWCRKGGKKSWGKRLNKLKEFNEKNPLSFYFLLYGKRLKKTVKKLIVVKKFKNKAMKLNIENIAFSEYDKKRKIRIPKTMSEELAEEIGIHLGDGTLPNKKYYFSVRGGYNEEEYYTKFVLSLYKKIYNIELPLIKRSSACGFEVNSKALYNFKNKTLGFVTGIKTHRIEVPKQIIDGDNEKIMRAFIRGVFDTDGCFSLIKKGKYPVISLTIKSISAIESINEILKKLGFDPYFYSKGYSIYLNGPMRFIKWMNEIGTNNPKHKKRIEIIKSKLPWSNLDKLFAEANNSSKDAGLRNP